MAGVNAPAPTSVVFDVGNVLVDWDPRAFFARQASDAACFDRLIGDLPPGTATRVIDAPPRGEGFEPLAPLL